MSLSVVVARTPEDAEAHLPAWDELAGTALEPNVFQESWMVLPGWRAFGGHASVQVLFVYGDRLDGVFVLERVPRLYGLPIPVLRSWVHPYSPLGTPLIRADAASACLDALFAWLQKDRAGAPVLQLMNYGADGPFHQALMDCARRRKLARFNAQTYSRAVLHHGDAGAGVISARSRRELLRQRRRLAEAGRLELRALQPGEAPEPWIRAFLDLERAGWKGRAGTALASHAADQAFFEQIAHAAHERGQLRLLGLFFDDRPLALKCCLLAPPGSFGWKIAFDEEFSRFSPGIQLELDHVEAFQQETQLAWMDSCTSEGHEMFERLWPDRREIAVTLLSTGRTEGRVVVSALDPLRRLYRRLRGINPREARHSAPFSPVAARIAPAAPPDPAARP